MNTQRNKIDRFCPVSNHPQAAPTMAIVMLICGLTLFPTIWTWGQCDYPIPPRTPLNDLGPESYKNEQGGLYPGGLNQRPPDHNQAGILLGDAITPTPPPNGGPRKIVMISVGMSNTKLEFVGANDVATQQASFIYRASHDDNSLNSQYLVLVNGALPEQDVDAWADTEIPWDFLADQLTAANVTANQVQIAWIKLALAEPERFYPPPSEFPAHAEHVRGQLVKVLQKLHDKYPNCTIAYLSTRSRAYSYVGTGLTHSPEPYAYETGFAVKWLIQQQIYDHDYEVHGGPLNYDDTLGTVESPWICWGPYFWTDGLTPRSDELIWRCNLNESESDVRSVTDTREFDYVHPTANGIGKVSDQLLAFFKTDPTAKGWFKKTFPGTGPQVSITSDPPNPQKDELVRFTGGPDGMKTYNWNFDDGDCVIGQNVKKKFPAPGTYFVRLTVVENTAAGKWATATKTINIAR